MQTVEKIFSQKPLPWRDLVRGKCGVFRVFGESFFCGFDLPERS